MPLGNVLQALIVLAVVLVGSVFVGNLFRRIRQPAVVGVIFFGLLLGTILAISPHSVNSALLSPTSKSLIEAVGQAGLLLLLFLVGIELRSYSKQNNRAVTTVATPALRADSGRRLCGCGFSLRTPTGRTRPQPAACVVVRRCGAQRHRRSRPRADHERPWCRGAHPGCRAADCRRDRCGGMGAGDGTDPGDHRPQRGLRTGAVCGRRFAVHSDIRAATDR